MYIVLIVILLIIFIKIYFKSKKGKNAISQNTKSITTTSLDSSNQEIIKNIPIPEPTRSLLWTTSENPDKAPTSLGPRITFKISENGVEVEPNDDYLNEPSLIWLRLPIRRNSSIETEKMYYPAYSRLSPEHRYQYLNWLRAVEQDTNLSYVFLYYYGLERHLILGKYDEAASEIIKLMAHHDKGSFKSYATTALIVSSLYHGRHDIFEKAPFLLEEVTNEALAVRLITGKHLSAADLLKLASPCGFKNKRYIKLYPDEFKATLQTVLTEFVESKGQILDLIETNNLQRKDSSVFANYSKPENIRQVKVPQIISNPKFVNYVTSLLSETHQRIKASRAKSRLLEHEND